MLRESSKYNFNDGTYRISKFSGGEVYVMHVDEDTIAVFPVKEFKDSTAIITKNRVNYTPFQQKFKDKKITHVFYKPSLDVDLMTIPLKYRPAINDLPNQINTNFNGAIFGGYRLDEYKLSYQRTPLNNYKQQTKHKGYSAGLYLGIGGTNIDPWVIKDPKFNLQYEGVLLISGIAMNMAADKFTFGVSFGTDQLLDKYHKEWIYQSKPCLGFTLGLDLNN